MNFDVDFSLYCHYARETILEDSCRVMASDPFNTGLALAVLALETIHCTWQYFRCMEQWPPSLKFTNGFKLVFESRRSC